MGCENLGAIHRAKERQNLEFLVRDHGRHLGNSTAACGPQAVCVCLGGSETSGHVPKCLFVRQWVLFLFLFFNYLFFFKSFLRH